jgi:hypothetical protein
VTANIIDVTTTLNATIMYIVDFFTDAEGGGRGEEADDDDGVGVITSSENASLSIFTYLS